MIENHRIKISIINFCLEIPLDGCNPPPKILNTPTNSNKYVISDHLNFILNRSFIKTDGRGSA